LNLIECKEITKRYGKTVAINNISFGIASGCTLGLLGPNGAGKTTLVRVLVGLLKVEKGSVSICGFDTQERKKELKMKIAFILDEPIFLENLTVQEHLKLINTLYDVSNSEALNAAIKKWGLEKYRNERLCNLSKGNRKRVAIASAFIRNFVVLIMDEPFKELDIYGRNLLQKDINKFKRMGKTIILTSHEAHIIHKSCDHLALINDGKLMEIKSLAEINKNISAMTYKDFEEYLLSTLSRK